MTQPNPAEQPQSEPKRSTYRPGQVTTFRVADPTSGQQVSGHGLVLKVTGDVADLAVIGVAHVQVHVDNIAPAKLDEVPNPLPAPAPAEDAPGS